MRLTTKRMRFAPILAASIILLVVSAHVGVAYWPGANVGYAAAEMSFAYPEFGEAWLRTDGPVASGAVARSWLWGPAPGKAVRERFTEAQEGARTVQYFDKARMELNDQPAGSDPKWRVTTGLLVAEMVTGGIQTGVGDYIKASPATQVIAGDPGRPGNPTYDDFVGKTGPVADMTGSPVTATLDTSNAPVAAPQGDIRYERYSPETGHNIPGVFWSYLNSRVRTEAAGRSATEEPLFDWVYVMGYPITEAYWAKISVAGKPYLGLVQLYQRRTLTYLPDLPDGWKVQMGNVGQHYYDWRYQKGSAPVQSPVMPPLRAAIDDFVGIDGAGFTFRGKKVKLKGSNYWLSAAPFAQTWAGWNGPRARTELQKARELGVNTIRIGIPYDNRDTRDVVWGSFREMKKVSPWIISQMTQVLQIASEYDMKVIFTLFEWYDQQPAQGSAEEATNLAYINGIVGAFAEDDRVLAWDLRNEPDFYPAWQEGRYSEVIGWLKRMALHVRSLDSRHPVTVGVGDYKSVWKAASDGTTLNSFVDFVAFHAYDAGALSTQIKELKAHTSKPLLLEEMGWPTSPGRDPMPKNAQYDEATQTFLYRTMLEASRGADIAGVVQWTLWDFVPGVTYRDDYESYFGLVKRDGTYKPAAEVFKRDYSAPPLASRTRSSLPLDTSDKPNVR